MTDDDAPEPPHVPLPPELPAKQNDFDGDQPLNPAGTASGESVPDEVEPVDLMKTAGPAVPHPGRSRHEPAPSDVAEEVPNATPQQEWWRGDDVRDDLRDSWQDTTGEVSAAAQEIGHQVQQAAGTISAAVAATTYPAAKARGLDIRWMRLAINLPAIVLALLATWGGRTATDRMITTITEDGPFAPLGFVIFFFLVGGLLLLTPIGTPLAQALAHLVTAVAQGLVAVVRRAWITPVTGYLMRLLVAWGAWAFVFAIIRVAGRGIIHWLTGA